MSPAARPQLHLESFGMSSSDTSQNLPIQPSPENSAGEQPVSQRRIEANRRNALRSTGPKSARGKDMAARNSWKHGLLAKSAVIMLGPAKENKAEFEELLSGLRDYFDPVGAAEELLVEEIAVSYWMERRAQLYENGEILKQARAAVKDEPWKELGYDGEVDDILDNISGDPENKPLFKQLLMSSQGLEYVLSLVAQVRHDADTGKVSAELLEQLSDICGGDWESAAREKSAFLAQLDSEKERLERLKKKIERIEAEDRAARVRSALLLDPRKLAVLQRYTSANERRRYRALARLERLQRQRNGEAVPPPIDVQVTSDADDFAKRSQ